MAQDEKDWNFDRIHYSQALIADVQNDMMRCLHKGQVVDVVRERIIQRLQSAAKQISLLKVNND